MRQQLGFVLQLVVLMFLPLLIGWQLFFGFRLILMPLATLAAIGVFAFGHLLRKPSSRKPRSQAPAWERTCRSSGFL